MTPTVSRLTLVFSVLALLLAPFHAAAEPPAITAVHLRSMNNASGMFMFDVDLHNDGSAGSALLRISGFDSDGLNVAKQAGWPDVTVGPDQHTIVEFIVQPKWLTKISKVRVAIIKLQTGETVSYLDSAAPLIQTIGPGPGQPKQLSDKQVFGSYVEPVDAASGYQATFYNYMNDADFDGLNRLFMTVNHDDARTSNGDWTLGSYQAALDERLDDRVKRADAEATIQRWVALQPKSMAAQFANAIVAIEKVRRFATHLGDQSDESAPKLVHDAAAVADRDLQQMSAEAKTSALWWTLKIELVGAQGGSTAAILDVHQKAEKLHPHYAWTTVEAANELARQASPDWRGIEGIAQNARLVAGGVLGDEIYASTMLYVDRTYCHCSNILTLSGGDWQVMRSGMLDLMDQYPGPVNLNQLASYACRAGDKATYYQARSAIKPDELYPPVWISGSSPDLCEKRFNRAA